MSDSETEQQKRSASPDEEAKRQKKSGIDPRTVALKTFTKVVPRSQVQRVWNTITPDVSDAIESTLRMLATAAAVDPVSARRSRPKDAAVLQGLVDDLVPKLQRTKLPPGDKTRDFDLQTLQRVKVKLEAELSANLQQVETLEETLKKEEKQLGSSQTYFANFVRNAKENLRLLRENEGNLQIQPDMPTKKITNTDIDLQHDARVEIEISPYDPATDEELTEVLEKLERKLETVPDLVKEFAETCARLSNLAELAQSM